MGRKAAKIKALAALLLDAKWTIMTSKGEKSEDGLPSMQVKRKKEMGKGRPVPRKFEE